MHASAHVVVKLFNGTFHSRSISETRESLHVAILKALLHAMIMAVMTKFGAEKKKEKNAGCIRDHVYYELHDRRIPPYLRTAGAVGDVDGRDGAQQRRPAAASISGSGHVTATRTTTASQREKDVGDRRRLAAMIVRSRRDVREQSQDYE